MTKTTRPRLTLRFWLVIGTALLLLVSELVSAIPNLTSPLERIELALHDGMMRLRGRQPVSGEVVIVAVDDFSFNWTGLQWPWPRQYLAEVVDQLNRSGVQLVGVDIFLFEPGYDAGGDQALAEALGQSPASVAVMQIFEDPAQGTVTLKLPLDPYRQVLDGMGISGVSLDDDAIDRGLQVFDRYGDQVFYHWAFQIAALHLNTEAPVMGADSVTFNGRTVPLYNGRFLVNFAGPAGTYPIYSIANVHDGLVDPSAFKDKIVLIGATSVTLHDLFPTPFSSTRPTPGVEIVANAVDTILTGKYLYMTPPWVNLLGILAMGVLAWFLGRSRRPSLVMILTGVLLLVYLVAAFVVFLQARLYLPVIHPELMLFLGVVLPSIEQAVSQERERRRVRNLFTRFISPEMVDQLLTTQDINSLNKRADVSILFSDIRGFTSLSERLTPEEVVALLNPYLEAMTAIVHKHGGTIDKYEGDAVVAFFGEPVPYADHAVRAVGAAVDMHLALVELRKLWAARASRPQKLEIGIGINSGEVFVGLLGSEQRINYTIIGDNANLASRLQDQTKIIGWPILVSERTATLVQGEFDVEFAALQAIKGKSEPVKIYKVLGRKGAPENERVRPLEA